MTCDDFHCVLYVVQLGDAVRRHCHSTGDMLSTSSNGQHTHAVDMLPPTVRLRHNRPKSEGSFCADKMRVKRASSFGVRPTNFFHVRIFSHIDCEFSVGGHFDFTSCVYCPLIFLPSETASFTWQ